MQVIFHVLLKKYFLVFFFSLLEFLYRYISTLWKETFILSHIPEIIFFSNHYILYYTQKKSPSTTLNNEQLCSITPVFSSWLETSFKGYFLFQKLLIIFMKAVNTKMK